MRQSPTMEREAFDFRTVDLVDVGRLFGHVCALAGVNLHVGTGEVCLLAGPNGSGKSTLLRVLSTLLQPSTGRVRFDSRTPDVIGRGLRGRIAYLSHRTQLHGDLTGRECLRLGLELLGGGAASGERLRGWLARFALEPFADRPVRTYSRGQAQRIALARALLGRPRLVLLDEPTTGLDRDSTGVLRSAIAEEAARGAAVVVSTHDPAALADIATRRIELAGGRVAADVAAGGGAAAGRTQEAS